MTDNEIKKVCKDCLHYEACKGTYSSAKGDEDILYDFDGEMYANSGCEDFQEKDLINRLQAENERLKNTVGILTNNAVDFANEIDRHKKDKEAYLRHSTPSGRMLRTVVAFSPNTPSMALR